MTALTRRRAAPSRRIVLPKLGGIEGRLIAASLLFALLVAGVFAVLLLAVSELRAATRAEARAKDRTVKTVMLQTDVLNLQTNARAYALSLKPDFKARWTQTRAVLKTDCAHFRTLFTDTSQRRRARQLVALITDYADNYSANIINIAEGSTPQAASSRDAVSEDRTQIGGIEAGFRHLLDAEGSAAQRQSESADDRSRLAVVAGVGGLGLSAFLVILFGAYITRSIGRPIRAASAGAARVAAGDFEGRLEETGPTEVRDLARAFNDMTERVEASLEQLERQNAQLRESERLKSELVSIVSHELRTPLASVLGFTSLLLQRDFSDADRRRYLEIIDSQSRRLSALVNDFLDAQRVDEGRLDMTLVAFDLADSVREQAQLFAGQSQSHEIRVHFDNGTSLPVYGDRDRLAQVLANLLSNAIKYSPDGGPVDVAAVRDDDTVRIEVHDEGRGIATKEQSRIFTKFFRGDAGASGIGGTGLGLALAREIVEAHGGRIGFTSDEGAGSTFWFEVPANREKERSGE